MRIRLIGVKLSGMVHGAHQINLFEETQDDIALLQAMDEIKDRFGKQSVMNASGFGVLKRNNQS